MRLIDLEDFIKRTSSENNIKFIYKVIPICSTTVFNRFRTDVPCHSGTVMAVQDVLDRYRSISLEICENVDPR
jgi:hypothetical protein